MKTPCTWMSFDPDKHIYYYDDPDLGREVYPSVTQLLAPLHRFDDISPGVLEYAARRGTAVHAATEQIDMGIDPEDIEELDAETAPYINAYQDFLRDYSPEIIHSERIFYHDWKEYAGTIDRVAIIDGKVCVIDIKTTASASRETQMAWAAQLAGYEAMLNTYNRYTYGSYILHLRKDGTYRLIDRSDIESKYDFYADDLFYRCLELYNLIGRKS